MKGTFGAKNTKKNEKMFMEEQKAVLSHKAYKT